MFTSGGVESVSGAVVALRVVVELFEGAPVTTALGVEDCASSSSSSSQATSASAGADAAPVIHVSAWVLLHTARHSPLRTSFLLRSSSSMAFRKK